MSGLKSLRRGKRAEYLCRDYLRNLGYRADRVPCSGNSNGFKGDIRFSKDGQSWLAEVKNHTGKFKTIYDLYFAMGETVLTMQLPNDVLILLSTDISLALEKHAHFPEVELDKKMVTKLTNLQEFVKGCDVLALKDNRLPFLFVRFF